MKNQKSLKRGFLLAVTAILFLTLTTVSAQEAWKPVPGHLMSKWAKEVTPENVHQEYPRPMMVRDNWQNLNGLWDFTFSRQDRNHNGYDRKILVPFPIESALSGVKETVGSLKRSWYKRTFNLENKSANNRVLLHFGAVDWESFVYINDKLAGSHYGGYDPFSFDITNYLNEDGEQEIEVIVWDPGDHGTQATGKQSNDARSIWYTSVTGIWQTVWLEYVPQQYISNVKIIPEVDNRKVRIDVTGMHLKDSYLIEAKALSDGEVIGTTTGIAKNELFIPIENPNLWTPDNPFLYDLEIVLKDEAGNKVDEVKSYFGMRKISIGKADDGYTRILLNDKPLFQLGPLDQGWWPGGLYTAPTDEALRYDIEVTKALGFNMLRKHVKVEPQRFYYWCDKMGILVWQDMPNGGNKPEKVERSEESKAKYRKEYEAMVSALYNHPSIVVWVPFNEGWGQFDTEEIIKYAKNLDPTRLINQASGWIDKGVGDMNDVHIYPGPTLPRIEDNRVAVLGEFGGQGYAVKDHLWINDFSRAPDHFRTSKSEKALRKKYNELIEALYLLKKKGLSAAVYTQTTDVESEVNGIMTYDREVLKFDPKKLWEIHHKFYE